MQRKRRHVVGHIVAGLRLGAAILVAVATLAITASAFAAPGTWMPTRVRGVVVYLLDGKWEEVARGQALTQTSLRTLRNGRLTLAGPNVTLDVGPNSALQLAVKADGSANTIEQYLGSISVAAEQKNSGLIVRAGNVTLSSITGELSVLVADTGTSIIVASGTAAVTSAGGKKLVLDTGSYSADASGLIVLASNDVATTADQGAEPTQAAAATAAASNSAGNNGNANGAANGNGAGGNANGNNGNGAGGNGAAGNGNGNGNGGGNGNGNGNGGASGNGKGNNKQP